MKKKYLGVILALVVGKAAWAQNTNYGVASGLLGTNSSYFGFSTGVLTNGPYNSFFGAHVSVSPNVGGNNSALGSHSLHQNQGSSNSAVGAFSLYSNSNGHANVAIGESSLFSNSSGHSNTGVGTGVLYINKEGVANTAVGLNALRSNESDYNTAVGYEALRANSTGFENTAIGKHALLEHTRGVQNVAIGAYAHVKFNGNYNTAVGVGSGPAKEGFVNCTSLGYNAKNTSSNQVRLGNASVYSIGGYAAWSVVSDGRFKKDIKEDISGLAFIRKLRPVSYVLDRQAIADFVGTPDTMNASSATAKSLTPRQTGFVAQEVEAIVKKSGIVFSGVESPQNENDHYSLRYSEFVVPLVKAVQELTAMVESQQTEIKTLKQQLGIADRSDVSAGSSSQAMLFQNDPNPFVSDTEIKMTVPESTHEAQLIIYNMEGKQLKNFLVNDRGAAVVKVSGSELAAGIYLYALITDGKVVDTKRLLLTK